MNLTNPWYSKSRPRISDYNPVLHSQFYSSLISKTTPEPTFPSTHKRNYSGLNSNIISRSNLARNAGLQFSNSKAIFNHQRFYKTRPRNIFSDPISGVVKVLQTSSSHIDGLGTDINKTRQLHSVKQYEYSNIRASPTNDRIAGALRKHVASVPYVNPYVLKSLKEFY